MRAQSLTEKQPDGELEYLRWRVAKLEALLTQTGKSKERESNESQFLQTLLDTIPSPIFYKDVKGIYVGCNKAFERFIGLEKEQIIGKSVFDVAPRDLAEEYHAQDEALLRQHGVQTYEASVRSADGDRHEVIFNKATFTDADGGVAGLVGVMLDITERKKVELALKESELFTRSALNSLSAHIAVLNSKGVIEYTNNAWDVFAQSNGLIRYDFVGVNYLSICDGAQGRNSDEASAAAAGIRSVIAGDRQEFWLEYSYQASEGKQWFLMHVTRFKGEGPVRVVVVHENATERKRAEEVLIKARWELESRVRERTAQLAETNKELQLEIAEREKAEQRVSRQNEFMKHVLESLTHPFYVLDANTYEVVMANSAAAPGGLSPGTTCYALTHRRPLPCVGGEHLCPLQTVKKTKQPFSVEHVHYDKDGNPRNVEVHTYPIFDSEGNVVQVLEYSLDITDRKRLEEESRKNAEKIKLFAYSVSHDLKSPLIGINGLIRLLHKQYGDVLDERGKKYCDGVLKASEQVVALIEEINVYIKTKETPLKFETLNPKEIIETVRNEFGALLSTRRIKWSEPDGIPEIKADRVSLLRVFRNLVDNALKYGGEVLSEIAIEYEGSPQFHTFAVRDDGVGIKEKDCEEIFELFQRKQPGNGIEGTGLGLAIVREIGKQHGGNVWVKSQINKGATFYVSLSKDL